MLENILNFVWSFFYLASYWLYRLVNSCWQDLYIHVGWPLYRKYGHAFEVRIYQFPSSMCIYNNAAVSLVLCFYIRLYWHSKFQAFKLIVNDPDSILDSLTREVKEVGPNGEEVVLFHFWNGLSVLHNADITILGLGSCIGDKVGSCNIRGSERCISKKY